MNLQIQFIFFILTISMIFVGCVNQTEKVKREAKITNKIVAMEKNALDRWGNGDPSGYLEIFAADVTYFNPFEDHRIDGLEAMEQYYGSQAGQIFIDKYDMTNIKVQVYGNIAILTYNLFNFKKQIDGSLKETNRWNSTKVYNLTNGTWEIVHNIWSFLQPDIKQ